MHKSSPFSPSRASGSTISLLSFPALLSFPFYISLNTARHPCAKSVSSIPRSSVLAPSLTSFHRAPSRLSPSFCRAHKDTALVAVNRPAHPYPAPQLLSLAALRITVSLMLQPPLFPAPSAPLCPRMPFLPAFSSLQRR